MVKWVEEDTARVVTFLHLSAAGVKIDLGVA